MTPSRYDYQSHWFSQEDAKRGFLAERAHAEGQAGWRVAAVAPCDDYTRERFRTAGLLLLLERPIAPPQT